MRIPSKQAGPHAVVSLPRFVLQIVSPFVCGVSMDWKSKSLPLSSQSETSFCGPRQSLLTRSRFWPVFEMSNTRNPS